MRKKNYLIDKKRYERTALRDKREGRAVCNAAHVLAPDHVEVAVDAPAAEEEGANGVFRSMIDYTVQLCRVTINGLLCDSYAVGGAKFDFCHFTRCALVGTKAAKGWEARSKVHSQNKMDTPFTAPHPSN